MSTKYKAMVLSCMDPRFQPIVYNYLKRKKLTGKYSAFTIAGAALGVTHNKFKKWQNVFLENLVTSIKIHKIKKLIVINHQDCGVAKIINGKKKFNNLNEMNIHKNSFINFKKLIKKKFPNLKFEMSIISLNKKIFRFN